MQLLNSVLIIMICITSGYGEAMFIVCGNQPGEIYFSAVHPRWSGYLGFYYSSDMGENIQLRDSSEWSYGSFVADAADNTLHRVRFYPTPSERVSFDGGYTWTEVNQVLTCAYGSGVIPGEIYRMVENNSHAFERSIDNGFNYEPCSLFGFSDSTFIYSASLGVDSGEVYIWSGHGYLYYSTDHGEHFAFQGNMYSQWGINPSTFIINGAEPGEIYAFIYDPKVIWRITDYGNSAQLIADFPPVYNFWRGSIAASSRPGELYFLAIDWDGGPGGTIHIYHTTDYGQDWTFYEHVFDPESVKEPQISITPSTVNIDIWPNPTNAAFNISYELSATQDVGLTMYDIIGRQVWHNNLGIQSPGIHRLNVMSGDLPSGRYFICVGSEMPICIAPITIIK
jgi:hypothetical protein